MELLELTDKETSECIKKLIDAKSPFIFTGAIICRFCGLHMSLKYKDLKFSILGDHSELCIYKKVDGYIFEHDVRY